MADKVLEGFLRNQLDEGMALAAESDVLQLLPAPGRPPSRFVARFATVGLVEGARGGVEEAEGFDVGIAFPPDYLRRADVREVLTYLGPHRRPWHPNVRPPFICLHVRPGMPLVDLLYACHELWSWGLFATGDEGLNHAAAQWARHQDPQRFPVDPRPLKRRVLQFEVTEEPVREGAGT